jgi:hypothetical protein
MHGIHRMEGQQQAGFTSRLSCPSQLNLLFREASMNRDKRDTQDGRAKAGRFYIPFILYIPVKIVFQRSMMKQGYTGYTGWKGKNRQGLSRLSCPSQLNCFSVKRQ